MLVGLTQSRLFGAVWNIGFRSHDDRARMTLSRRRLSMANMDAFALQNSDLNGFLLAEIGVEGSGLNLSVISALARLGLDPWQEAGRLARLPRGAAVEGLAKLIAAMPASLWSLADATVIAARLVALLPRHDGVPSVASVKHVAVRLGSGNRVLVMVTVALAAIVLLAVGISAMTSGSARINGPLFLGATPTSE
jgi:hypothetical protein